AKRGIVGSVGFSVAAEADEEEPVLMASVEHRMPPEIGSPGGGRSGSGTLTKRRRQHVRIVAVPLFVARHGVDVAPHQVEIANLRRGELRRTNDEAVGAGYQQPEGRGDEKDPRDEDPSRRGGLPCPPS